LHGNLQRIVQIHSPTREQRAQRHAFDELPFAMELPVSLRADLVNR